MLRRLMVFTLACTALAAFAWAQEGHPLTGSWHGQWTPEGAKTNNIVMFLRWENRQITGTINPGRASIAITSGTLDADKWMVHLEAKTKEGEPIVIDGKLDDIGSYNRTITGTWMQGPAKGDFKLTRD